MINKIILSLYDYYRKNNDSHAATFHSKALMGLFLLMLSVVIFFFLVTLIGADAGFDKEMNAVNLKLVFIGIIAVIIFILWFSTDSNEILEIKRDSAERKYRIFFFAIFYLSIPLLIYLISVS